MVMSHTKVAKNGAVAKGGLYRIHSMHMLQVRWRRIQCAAIDYEKREK